MTKQIMVSYCWYKNNQHKNNVNHNYLLNRTELFWEERILLIDWITAIHERYRLSPEVLFTCIRLMDNFFSMNKTKNEYDKDIKLIGITCLWIASKYFKRHKLNSRALCVCCSNKYTEQQFYETEKFILETVDYQVFCVLSIHFLYLYLSGVHETKQDEKFLFQYFLGLSLHHDFLFVESSTIFHSVLICVLGVSKWKAELLQREMLHVPIQRNEFVSILQCTEKLNQLANSILNKTNMLYMNCEHLDNIQKKYSSQLKNCLNRKMDCNDDFNFE